MKTVFEIQREKMKIWNDNRRINEEAGIAKFWRLKGIFKKQSSEERISIRGTGK